MFDVGCSFGLALDEPLLRDLKKAGVYGFTIHSENEVDFLQTAGPYHQESRCNFEAGLYPKPYDHSTGEFRDRWQAGYVRLLSGYNRP